MNKLNNKPDISRRPERHRRRGDSEVWWTRHAQTTRVVQSVVEDLLFEVVMHSRKYVQVFQNIHVHDQTRESLQVPC